MKNLIKILDKGLIFIKKYDKIKEKSSEQILPKKKTEYTAIFAMQRKQTVILPPCAIFRKRSELKVPLRCILI